MSYDDFDDDDYDDDTEMLLQKLRRDLQRVSVKALEAQQRGLQNDTAMIETFNRMAKAIEGLTEEVKALRADLTPGLDKPRKLPLPGKGA